MESKGLFRMAADADEVDRAREVLLQQGVSSFEQQHWSAHTATALLKSWLRELPNPLLAPVGIQALEGNIGSNASTQLLEAARLPRGGDAERLFFWLVDLMAEVVSFSSSNRMTVQAMSVVMAPNLIDMAELEERAQSVDTAFQATKKVAKLLQQFLQDYVERQRAEKALSSATTTGALSSTGRATASATTTSSAPASSKKNGVSFGKISVHEHGRRVGGCQTVPSDGPPLGIGWERVGVVESDFDTWDRKRQEDTRRLMKDRDEARARSPSQAEYEAFKYHMDGKLSAETREQLLVDGGGGGGGDGELQEATEEMARIRANRKQTARNVAGKKVLAGEDPEEVQKWEEEQMVKEAARKKEEDAAREKRRVDRDAAAAERKRQKEAAAAEVSGNSASGGQLGEAKRRNSQLEQEVKTLRSQLRDAPAPAPPAPPQPPAPVRWTDRPPTPEAVNDIAGAFNDDAPAVAPPVPSASAVPTAPRLSTADTDGMSKADKEAAYFAGMKDQKEKEQAAKLAALSPEERANREAAEAKEKEHEDKKSRMLQKQMRSYGGGAKKAIGRGRGRGRGKNK
jgi:hypothetical protein